MNGLAQQTANLPTWANTRLNLHAAMGERLLRHHNPGAAAAIDLGKTAAKSVTVQDGLRHFTQLVAPHLFRPGYRVRRSQNTPTRARATPRKDRGVGDSEIAFRSTTVDAQTITHELGHTLEYQNRGLLRRPPPSSPPTRRARKSRCARARRQDGNYRSNEYYRPGLSEKREPWRYATKIYPGWASDPSIGPYNVWATELISSGLEWLEHEPETLFLEVPAFADFMVRRVVLRPED